MSRRFQCRLVPSTWLEKNGRRLDCGPYLSGAIEAMELIRKIPATKEPLQQLTSGIFHAGREGRLWVDSPDYGVPFMGSTDILASDLSNLPLISRKQIQANPSFTIHEGWTLITRSGTIGRMAYARSDMDGIACSEHVMRVVPDCSKVKPGFIYAYLSSRFGVSLIVSGTYGSIIQSIEPQHISDLPVPRLGSIEDHAHNLIKQAAELHIGSIALRKQAGELINEICGFTERLAPAARNFAFSTANSNNVLKRLDATFHNPIAQLAEELTAVANGISLTNAGVRGFESNRLKQIFVEDGSGTPFIKSGSIFLKTISPERLIRNKLLGPEESWCINECDTLLARSGQVGGIIGRGVWADSRFDGYAASPHILRLRSTSREFPPGYVYAFLCLTDVGYQLLARTAAGSSIPFLPLNAVLEIKIPSKPTQAQRDEIDELVRHSGKLRSQSQELEIKAISLVEQTIEVGGR